MTKLIKLSLIVTHSLLIYTFVNIYRADSYAKSAEIALKALDLKHAQKLAKESIRFNPNEPYYYRMLAKIYLTKALTDRTYKDQTLTLLDTSLELNKNNLATIRNNTPIYYYLTLDDVKDEGSDKKYIKFVSEYMTHYKKVYPNDLGLMVLFAKYEKKLNLTQNYKESIERIKVLRPDILTWYAGI